MIHDLNYYVFITRTFIWILRLFLPHFLTEIQPLSPNRVNHSKNAINKTPKKTDAPDVQATMRRVREAQMRIASRLNTNESLSDKSPHSSASREDIVMRDAVQSPTPDESRTRRSRSRSRSGSRSASMNRTRRRRSRTPSSLSPSRDRGKK